MRVKLPTRSAAAPRIGRGQQEYFNGLLGLSISYDIVVHGHQGAIGVETGEGSGTEFIVTIPASS